MAAQAASLFAVPGAPGPAGRGCGGRRRTSLWWAPTNISLVGWRASRAHHAGAARRAEEVHHAQVAHHAGAARRAEEEVYHEEDRRAAETRHGVAARRMAAARRSAAVHHAEEARQGEEVHRMGAVHRVGMVHPAADLDLARRERLPGSGPAATPRRSFPGDQ